MAGLKYSRQREAVLVYLRSTKSHPTAEQVYQKIREEFPKISLGTVYRNLNLLADCGEILRLNCGDGVEHFDATTTPHNHFICRRCRQVIDLEADWDFELDTKMDDEFPGKIEGHKSIFTASVKNVYKSQKWLN
ncbi:MAG: transcriptional repressor [Clostridium sp.]